MAEVSDQIKYSNFCLFMDCQEKQQTLMLLEAFKEDFN